MAKFLTTKSVAAEIENIIINARTRIVLVSPYISISNIYIQNLKSMALKGVRIQFVFREKDLKQIEIDKLKTIPKLELYYNSELHAKCYFNESKMIITSLNLYDYSEKNNREFGVLVDKSEDNQMFQDAASEVGRIIEHSTEINIEKIKPIDLPKKKEVLIDEVFDRDEFIDDSGYCIRCSDTIEFNPEKPMCYTCFKVWQQYEDPDYTEKFCHACGSNAKTSMNKPLDRKCFNEYLSPF